MNEIKITTRTDSGKVSVGTPGSREGWPTRHYTDAAKADRRASELAEVMPRARVVYIEQ